MKTKNLRAGSIGLMVVIILVFSSCSKKKNTTDSLVGTWTVGTTTFTSMINDKTVTQYFMDALGLSATDANTYAAIFNATVQQQFTGTITIKSDNTYTASLGGDSETGTWSLSADGMQLTINSASAGTNVFDIVELTSSVLKVQLTETESEDLNADGTDETITTNATVTFNR